ncbi:MAG: cation transporter [Phycisphaerales bacterium]|jgi:cation diffusion facilitator family transporter|nr:cation transporter [Phycisphaerales bacterium]
MQPVVEPTSKWEKRAAMLSLCVAVLLLGIKFSAYFLTRSAAIFSDALESIVNVVAAAFAMYSLSVAHRPADRDHPYGHGKIEFLSAGFEGGMILLAAVVIVVQSLDLLINGTGHLRQGWLGICLMVLAMMINGIVGWILMRVGSRRTSMTLVADGQHLLMDALSSLAVVAGLLIVVLTDWQAADPIVAMLVAVYIAWMGGKLLKQAAAGLMDRQDEADTKMLEGILESHMGPQGRPPLICSYHKLRHRHSGRYHWVDFHIMVPGELNIEQGHHIASTIEYEIEQALRIGNATAHVEPCKDDACAGCRGGDK